MATSARQATALAVLEPKQQQPATSVIDFDAAKHLNYSPPSSSISMDELHFPLAAISAVDSTQPFPLLSHDAVVEHRRVLFSKPVLENCLYRTRAGSAQLRGMAPHYAPFIYQFWSSPEVLKIISEHAGVKLLPVVDFEIATRTCSSVPVAWMLSGILLSSLSRQHQKPSLHSRRMNLSRKVAKKRLTLSNGTMVPIRLSVLSCFQMRDICLVVRLGMETSYL